MRLPRAGAGAATSVGSTASLLSQLPSWCFGRAARCEPNRLAGDVAPVGRNSWPLPLAGFRLGCYRPLMAGRIHVGAVLQRPPARRYVDALRFAELSPTAPLPRPTTLRRWRASLPEDFVVALRVPPEAIFTARGPLRLGDEGLDEALRWVGEAADALQAALLVVPTGAAVRTGQRDRRRLADYFERLRETGRTVVWAPDGLWRADLACREAERLGVVAAVDPFEDPVPPGGVAYLRLKALGARPRFSEGMLLDLADALEQTSDTECFAVFESPRAFREARRLAALLGEQPEDVEAPASDEAERMG